MLNLPNLDCMDGASLMTFWAKHQGGRSFRDIFPEGGRGKRRAVADLANYASNKATAMSCRARGDISGALLYEGICDSIYSNMDHAAKW